MEIMIMGLCLFSAVHFIPSLAPQWKTSITAKIGPGPYQGVFALTLVTAIVLIVYGWRHSVPATVYIPLLSLRPLTMVLMFVSLLLFVASKPPTRIKRILRHPQLSAVILWSAAHLLSNGDSRSVLLFGTLGVWAFLEIVFINRRDGAWQKPAAPALKNEIILLVLATVVYAVVVFAHPWLSGMPLI